MFLIVVERSVGPEPAGVYKIQSGNHSLVEITAHTHRVPARHTLALTLKNHSLRSNRRSIRHNYKQSQKLRRHVVRK